MSQWHDRREIGRMYRAWVADDSILHTINSWEEYTKQRGWTMTRNGLVRTCKLESSGKGS